VRKFFTTVLFLITLPAFAYGPMIISDGITTAPIPDQGNNYGPMIASDGIIILLEDAAGRTTIILDHLEYGPMFIVDGLAHGPMIVNDGLAHGPAIVIHG
jgi:hypothetical protein